METVAHSGGERLDQVQHRGAHARLPFWKGFLPAEVILAVLVQGGCGLLKGQTDARG